MTEIELTLTDLNKSESELEEIANSITIDFECGSVQLISRDGNKVYMF